MIRELFHPLPVGICPFSAVAKRLLPCRNAARLPEKAVSVICVLFPYYLGEPFYAGSNISRYAVSADYHTVAEEILTRGVERLRALYPDGTFAAFCDNSPIPEVSAAVAAGLGVRGWNGLLLNPTYGSYCFIGEIVTDIPLPLSQPSDGGCLRCGACRRGCPVGALSETGLDRERCLSSVTQKKGTLTEEQRRQIARSGCAWGCDKCQTVCPMNAHAAKTPLAVFAETAVPIAVPGADIRDRAYAWRGEKVIARNLEILSEKNK